MKKKIAILFMLLAAMTHSSFLYADARVCADKKVQQECPATCAQVCAKNVKFNSENWEYCISILPPSSRPDTPECEAIFLKTKENLTPVDPCADITELFAKIECEQKAQKKANKYPQCAPNIWTLIDNANDLSDKIENTFKGYAEILALDLTEVQDMSTLCVYSRDDLSRYYKQATEQGQEFILLQNNALEIETCAREFENWLSDASTNDSGVPDPLDDNLIRETRKALDKLEPLRSKLINSVEMLKAVGPKIYALAKRHALFCRSQED